MSCAVEWVTVHTVEVVCLCSLTSACHKRLEVIQQIAETSLSACRIFSTMKGWYVVPVERVDVK
jgi:hypothetical protein